MSSNQTWPPEEQIEQIREVLEHLYDFVYLQAHPLTDRLYPDNSFSPRERGRYLRTLVLRAMERMSPGAGVPLRDAEARCYSVLNLRYVEGMDVADIATELVISERQVYRDLRRAERELLNYLWREVEGETGIQSISATHPSRAALIDREARRLYSNGELVDLRELLVGAIESVRQLARQQGCEIQLITDVQPIELQSVRGIVRQVLVSVLSYVVQNAQLHSPLRVVLERRGNGAAMQIAFSSQAQRDSLALPEVLLQLLKHLAAHAEMRAEPAGQTVITLKFQNQLQPCLLIIDDNKGLVDLFERYLEESPYQVLAAFSGAEGLQLAEQNQPDLIILDVMMPERDGWEVLQRLQNQNSTRHIPVIVCSVLDDSKLAYSLGATDFLAKPVSQPQLLAAVDRCLADSV